ncbi:hypothetical protein Ccrd_017901 [Cynara cardunculus var. scolymus]|uniref:Uncharacterized protein n=1 Tax=Cynara cardunculus var. scolymus TaxID=59895 RepID=A0A118K247_CYNCS|nr:hypothetical protein Ccrd_017901 [Cynara cardunculus var. scolymus]
MPKKQKGHNHNFLITNATIPTPLPSSSSSRNSWCHILGCSIHTHSPVHTLPLISITTATATVCWCSSTPPTSVAAIIIPSTTKITASVVPSTTTVVSTTTPHSLVPESRPPSNRKSSPRSSYTFLNDYVIASCDSLNIIELRTLTQQQAVMPPALHQQLQALALPPPQQPLPHPPED